MSGSSDFLPPYGKNGNYIYRTICIKHKFGDYSVIDKNTKWRWRSQNFRIHSEFGSLNSIKIKSSVQPHLWDTPFKLYVTALHG